MQARRRRARVESTPDASTYETDDSDFLANATIRVDALLALVVLCNFEKLVKKRC